MRVLLGVKVAYYEGLSLRQNHLDHGAQAMLLATY